MHLLFAVVAVCLLWCAAAGSSSSVASSSSSSLQERELLWSRRYYQRKTFFSNTSRAVFVAGLEGSGHHLVRDIADGCTGVDEAKQKKKGPAGGKNSINKKNKWKSSTGRQLAETISGGGGGGSSQAALFHERCVVDKPAMCLLYNNTPKTSQPHDSLFNSRRSSDTFHFQREACVRALRACVRACVRV